jgi:Tfp pilus assembly protein PilO
MNRQITIVVFLSLALILGIVLVWPKYQELRLLEQRNEEKRNEIQGREKYLQDLKKADEELKSYQNQLAKIDSALPPNPGLEVLLNFLQKASSQSGLVFKDIQPSASRAVSGTKELPELEGLKETEISFAVAGNYPSFKNFLSVLEMTARLIEVESISFSSTEEEGPQNFNLLIKVYSY